MVRQFLLREFFREATFNFRGLLLEFLELDNVEKLPEDLAIHFDGNWTRADFIGMVTSVKNALDKLKIVTDDDKIGEIKGILSRSLESVLLTGRLYYDYLEYREHWNPIIPEDGE